PLLGKNSVRPLGFEDRQALLPYGPRSFQGYRLLQEYFSFPERYMFAELCNLESIIRGCTSDTLELAILLDRGDSQLANRVDAADFSLFSCPAINLFPKRADRIHLSPRVSEHHVVADRTRPMDFEVYQVQGVTGHGTTAEQEREFQPFYALSDASADHTGRAYYSLNRQPRVLSANQRKVGPRSSYIGSETFISLVDAMEAPFAHDLRQLSVQTLCTNRDLPLQMPVGTGDTDFTLEESAPVQSIHCLVGPTKPRPSKSFEKGQTTWRLVSHLALNYLSLTDDASSGAGALRELLTLYSDTNDVLANKQIDGVRSIDSRPVTRPITSTGPLSFGRGLEVTLTLDEGASEGSSAFLLAAVLKEFFTKYVSINSFTETVLKTAQRGEVMRWPARMGRRELL
ncbi:MAG: type VI secretion system baseplate subunit TssF, partial [Planctomycetales bacterium]|nr:type VI secretion system baseplate subunit TssF [Planctomycetales bacterium]